MSQDSCKLHANLAAAQVHLLWEPPENSWGAVGERDGRWHARPELERGFFGRFCVWFWWSSFLWDESTAKRKHCKESFTASWAPRCLWVASQSQWLGHAGIWDHLNVQVCCFGKQRRLWRCIRRQDVVGVSQCRWLPHSHVQGLPSNPQKQFIVQAFFWGQ